MDPFDFQWRVADTEWHEFEEDSTPAPHDDTVLFMMEDRDCNYVTYDGEVPYLPGVSGKVEYRRKVPH